MTITQKNQMCLNPGVKLLLTQARAIDMQQKMLKVHSKQQELASALGSLTERPEETCALENSRSYGYDRSVEGFLIPPDLLLIVAVIHIGEFAKLNVIFTESLDLEH